MQSLVIIGRRWWNSAGYTMCSSEVIIDGEFVPEANVDGKKGGGSDYVYNAFNKLVAIGKITDCEEGEQCYRYISRKGIKLANVCIPVKNLRDLNP